MSDSVSTLRALPILIVEPEGCLTEHEILAFADGRLQQADLRRVHAHLDLCESCQHLVSEAMHPPLWLEPTLGDELPGFTTTFQPNSIVANRYRIQRFLCCGGMGEIYEAFDRTLQERVALKTVMSTASDSPKAVARLKTEVQLARRVSHPNVCRIYNLDTHFVESSKCQIHFFTMEFVEGETLGETLRRNGALPFDQCTDIARQLLEGLHAAHQAGILHRDFKSDNVMLREVDGRLEAVILDFGLARALDKGTAIFTSGSNSALTGTLPYMAPEQIEGKQLSRQSDIYAFGVVWFEMLTGALPFVAGSAAASALERLRRPPTAPSLLNPSVDVAIDAIVLRCLERFPESRFASAMEVLSALNSFLEAPGQPIPKRKSLALAPKRLLLTAFLVGAVLAVPFSIGAFGSTPSSDSAAPKIKHAVPQAAGILARPHDIAARTLGRGPSASPLPTTTGMPPAEIAKGSLRSAPSSKRRQAPRVHSQDGQVPRPSPSGVGQDTLGKVPPTAVPSSSVGAKPSSMFAERSSGVLPLEAPRSRPNWERPLLE